MDWEKPRKIAAEDAEEGVVAWRSLFIANEFNELQVEGRKIHTETNLIWFLFFWVAIGWKFYSLTNPDMTVINNPLQPFNMFLKFFLSAFIFLCIALVQYILYLIRNAMNTPKV